MPFCLVGHHLQGILSALMPELLEGHSTRMTVSPCQEWGSGEATDLNCMVSIITFCAFCPYRGALLSTQGCTHILRWTAYAGFKFASLDPTALLALELAIGTCRQRRVDQESWSC